MLTVTWKPNVGNSIVFNDNTLAYPIDGSGEPFQIEVEFSDPSIKKQQKSGEWPSFGYPGAARVIIEGHIIGTTSGQFWTRRNAYLVALTPPPGELTARRHGRLTIADDDMPEPMWAYCRVLSRLANLENADIMRCPFQVTWKSFETYFTGTVSGKPYLLG